MFKITSLLNNTPRTNLSNISIQLLFTSKLYMNRIERFTLNLTSVVWCYATNLFCFALYDWCVDSQFQS